MTHKTLINFRGYVCVRQVDKLSLHVPWIFKKFSQTLETILPALFL